MLTILFAFFFILLFLNLPVAFSIGLSSMIALCFYGDLPLSAIVTRMYSGVDSFTLLAIPFFIAAGEIMNESGITDMHMITARHCGCCIVQTIVCV